jgi:2-desacetyl-2-hydroxyethyl bacteriochlorophyllide A dehydrogenase
MNTSLGRSAIIVGPRLVETQNVDTPELTPGHVLLRSLYSGISAGTEMNVYRGLAPQWTKTQDPITGLFESGKISDWSYPLEYGYANVGEIIEVGDGVDPELVGRVAFSYSPHRDYNVAAATAVLLLPDFADRRIGVLNANLNTALNGVLDAGIAIGDVVVVSGLGVIGQLVTRLVAKLEPACLVVVDPLAKRRRTAILGGADIALDPKSECVAERVRELSANRGADVVIEVSGAIPALNEAIRTVGRDGRVVAMSWYGGSCESLSLSGEFHHNRPRIVSSQVGTVNPDLGPLWSTARRQERVSHYLGELDVAPLLTTELPISKAGEAYALVDSGDENVIQCILTYEE